MFNLKKAELIANTISQSLYTIKRVLIINMLLAFALVGFALGALIVSTVPELVEYAYYFCTGVSVVSAIIGSRIASNVADWVILAFEWFEQVLLIQIEQYKDLHRAKQDEE
jgi:hypothetical protein